MKKHLASLFFIIPFGLVIPCFGQFNTYHPFADSGASWRENNWWYVYCGIGVGYDGYSKEFAYSAKGDTVLNGKTYIKVNISGGFEYPSYNCPPSNDTAWQCYNFLSFLMRNDASSKKVYALFPPYFGADTLLFDFSLGVGDTLPATYNNNTNFGYYVSSIDSILIGGNYRKQYIISNGADSIIEGIGSSHGLIVYLGPPDPSGSLLECYMDSNLEFTYDANASCNMFYSCPSALVVATIKVPDQSVSVYPNPSTGKFALQLSVVGNQASVVRVYNVLGEEVENEELKATSNEIDLSAQPNGVYLYRVISQSGSLIGEGKVVVER